MHVNIPKPDLMATATTAAITPGMIVETSINAQRVN